MNSERDPFVTEITRIMQKSISHLIVTYRFHSRMVILVSRRFYIEAEKETDRMSKILGLSSLRSTKGLGSVRFRGLLLFPVPWLTDYEFEIRPPTGKPNHH